MKNIYLVLLLIVGIGILGYMLTNRVDNSNEDFVYDDWNNYEDVSNSIPPQTNQSTTPTQVTQNPNTSSGQGQTSETPSVPVAPVASGGGGAGAGFISPTTNSSWTLGGNMAIQIQTSPEWSHCSNGFYLYNTNNQEIGTIGILTNPGQASYTWNDTSERFATCGSGVGEYPIAVNPGSYKICLKEYNTETGGDSNFYCSGVFTLTGTTQPPVSNCAPNDPASITVLSPNGGEVFQAGQQITVTWESCNVPTDVDIGIDLKNRTAPNTDTVHTILGQTSNSGNAIVVLSPQLGAPSFALGNNFRVELFYVVNSGGPTGDIWPIPSWLQQGDISDNFFTIN